MSADPQAREAHLSGLRNELLDEMEAVEQELARLRGRIEREESDQRLGAAVTTDYEEMKGRQLPRAEARLLELYRSLIKIEQKILDTRSRGEG